MDGKDRSCAAPGVGELLSLPGGLWDAGLGEGAAPSW